MNVVDVEARIEAVKATADDDESAHLMEDMLRADVLAAIADGSAEDPAAMARLALTTSDIDFSRWYA